MFTCSYVIYVASGRRSIVLNFLRGNAAREKSPNRSKSFPRVDLPKNDALLKGDSDTVRYALSGNRISVEETGTKRDMCLKSRGGDMR